MRRNAEEGLRYPTRAGPPECYDCGSTHYRAYGLGPTDKPLELASTGGWTAQPTSPACGEVVSWLQAIDRLAFTLPRRTPLGLQLPIVPDLQQTDVAPPKRPDVVFELKHGLARFGPGLLVDAIGTVYRFQAYGDERVTLPVGRVPASSVAAMYRARRGGTWRPATESRQNCWYLLAFDPGSTAPDPIASDCEGGGRTTGADNVIAWLHALDEQANKVAGWMVRL